MSAKYNKQKRKSQIDRVISIKMIQETLLFYGGMISEVDRLGEASWRVLSCCNNTTNVKNMSPTGFTKEATHYYNTTNVKTMHRSNSNFGVQ